jgi:D-alanyl-D-alanine carboxypeptidase
MRKACLLGMAAALLAAAPAEATPSAATLRRELRAVVSAGAPGAIVLSRDGARSVSVAVGVGRRTPRAPMRRGDRFRVGSLTKTFVAATVLQLVADGALSLDDTAERWVPGLVPGGDAITVRQLLNHTSGLFDYLNDGDETVIKPYLAGQFGHVWAPRELVGVATKHPAHFPPGMSWSYSNTGYIVLGLIVEAATGHQLGEEVAARVLAPLALRGTSFDTAPRIAGRHAHGYFKVGKRLVDVTAVHPSYAWAAGAVVSTTSDLARFYRALLAGRVLRGDLLPEMEATVPMGPPNESYGLGLWRTHSLGFGGGFHLPCADTVWGHDGDIAGYLTYAFSSQDGRRQVVMSINDDKLSRKAERAITKVISTAYCG